MCKAMMRQESSQNLAATGPFIQELSVRNATSRIERPFPTKQAKALLAQFQCQENPNARQLGLGSIHSSLVSCFPTTSHGQQPFTVAHISSYDDSHGSSPIQTPPQSTSGMPVRAVASQFLPHTSESSQPVNPEWAGMLPALQID